MGGGGDTMRQRGRLDSLADLWKLLILGFLFAVTGWGGSSSRGPSGEFRPTSEGFVPNPRFIPKHLGRVD